MSTIFYFFRLGWPFLKEWILGGVSLKEGVKKFKGRVFLLFFVAALLVALGTITPRFLTLAQEHIKLKNSTEATEVQKLKDRVAELELQVGPKDTSSQQTSKKVEKPPDPVEVDQPNNKKIDDAAPVNRVRKTNATPRQSQDVDDGRKRAYMDFFDRYED